MPLAHALIVNQKLVFTRIEIAAAREIRELAMSVDDSIEHKLRQHAHLDSAVNQLASAFDFFVLEMSNGLKVSEQEAQKNKIIDSFSWLSELLAARDTPMFIAERFALEDDQLDNLDDDSEPMNLIASVSIDKENLSPIALLTEWSKEMQKIVDQYRASLLEE